jgi:hypothetical protein
MDVGVTTIHNHLNYGAALQVYALTKTVQRLGHVCKVIDNDIEPGHGRRYSRSRHPGEHVKNLYMACHHRAGRRFWSRFNDFFQNFIPKTEQKYTTYEELTVSPPVFDAFITGSDQVWNPGLLDRQLGALYHLAFADQEKTRLISYAPSFGVSEISDRYVKRIQNYLLRYHSISVRESRGKEIIKEISGRDAKHVLDPTLLLTPDCYDSIINKPDVDGEYMLVYPMEVGDNFSFYRVVKAVKKLLGIRVVMVFPLSFHHRWMLLADKIVLDAGPKEFLGLIKYASCVCTNSFHGTVFSVLFQKNFLGTPHSRTNARSYSLLEKIGLLDRQLSDWDEQSVQETLNQQISYANVAPLLNTERDQSLSYLQKALSA